MRPSSDFPAFKIKLKPRSKDSVAGPPGQSQSSNHYSNPNSSPPYNHNPNSSQQQANSCPEDEDGRASGHKRKHSSPSSSPASKRIFQEEDGNDNDNPETSASGKEEEDEGEEPQEVLLGSKGLPEILPDRSEQLSTDPPVIKHRLINYHASIAGVVVRELQGRLEDESSRSKNSTMSLENISHGQLQVISVVPSTASQDETTQNDSVTRPFIDGMVSQQVYPFASWTRPDTQRPKRNNVAIIPAHASWFSWDRIHKLERQAMPQLFFGKSKLQSSETFIQARNAIIMKYRSNPQVPISLTDIQGISNLGEKELGQMLEFLIQWGLVNYQADVNSEPAGFKFPTTVPVYLNEDESGILSSSTLSLNPLEYLYQYEPLQAPAMALKSLAMFEEPTAVVAENMVKESNGPSVNGSSGNTCSSCAGDCSQRYFYCEKQVDYVLCPDCYGDGKLGIGMTTTDFVPSEGYTETPDSFDSGNWTDHETLMLLEALEMYGDSWTEVSEFVGTKSKAQCISHFIGLSIEDTFLEDMEVPRSFPTVRTKVDTRQEHRRHVIDLESRLPSVSEKSGTVEDGKTPGDMQAEPVLPLAFEGASNPVMSLVAFLAATVGPRVAAVAAHSALASLSEEYQAAQLATEKQGHNMTANSSEQLETENGISVNPDHSADKNAVREKNATAGGLSKASLQKVTSSILSMAAMKAKLLADQEEREVQRLGAIIVDNQLKKLSVKLKQLGDIDTILEKEREQIERNRQRLSAERIRFINTRLNNPVSAPQMPIPGNMNPMNMRPAGPGPLSASPVPPAVIPNGGMIAAGPVHPSHMLRPTMYTMGPGGMAMLDGM